MRLLLLEADRVLGEDVARRLVDQGHWVERDVRLQDANLRSCDSFDVLIVSWRLPDGPGLPWVTQLRQRGVGTAAVMLARRHSGANLQAALAAGANDCLIVPDDNAILAARVRDARLRVAGLTSTCLRSGDVELDLESRLAFRGGVRVALTGREWNLVEALALRFDNIVPKSELAKLVHGANVSPMSTALEVHLSHVRQKLGRRLVRTVRGAGYLMTA